MKTIVIIGLFLASCGQEPTGDVKSARVVKTGGEVATKIKAILDRKISQMRKYTTSYVPSQSSYKAQAKAGKYYDGSDYDGTYSNEIFPSLKSEKEFDSIQSVIDSIFKESSREIDQVIQESVRGKVSTDGVDVIESLKKIKAILDEKVSTKIKAIPDRKSSEKKFDSIQSVIDSIFKESSGEIDQLIYGAVSRPKPVTGFIEKVGKTIEESSVEARMKAAKAYF